MRIRFIILAALLIACVFIWHIVLDTGREVLTVAFLDVGQGDAIFIESPTGTQVLIDGGEGGAVLRELARVMPFYDRSIDMLIATHPDADHAGGLISVLERYEVAAVLSSSVLVDTPVASAFAEALVHENAETITALRGKRFLIGGGAYIDILFPDRVVAGVESNIGSVVARLVYGDTSFLFTGDAPQAIEEYMVALESRALKSDVLKLGHHGSKTSSSPLLLGFASPDYAIISAGENNSYGHPHEEVLSALAQFDIQTLSTAENGTIIFTSDGKTLTME